MTIEEIEKAIDDANLVYSRIMTQVMDVYCPITERRQKNFLKTHIKEFLERGDTIVLYKHNKETNQIDIVAEIK